MRIKDYIKRLFEENNKKLISNINTSIDTKTQLVSLESYYSEQEQVVGRWTDGKPIYQKTIFSTFSANGTQNVIPLNTSIDTFINIDAFVYGGGFYNILNCTDNIGTAGNISKCFGRNKDHPSTPNTLIFLTTYQENYNVYATIQYTKATDTESVQFTLPALYKKDIKVNYSLEEQIIGTWIDGKPIYQKTFTGIINPTNDNFDEVSTEVSIGASIDNFVDYSAFLHRIDNSTFQTIYSRKKDNDCSIRITFFNNNSTNTSQLNSFRISNAWYKEEVTITYIVTVQYTKTTDTVANISQIPNLYDISRPDMWPENQEIYFGNKLYGYRYVEKNGNHTVNAKTSVGGTILTNVNIHHIVAQGGEIIGPDWNMPIGVHSNDFSIDCYYWVDHTNSSLKTSMENAHTQNFIWTGADAWVTYIKE